MMEPSVVLLLLLLGFAGLTHLVSPRAWRDSIHAAASGTPGVVQYGAMNALAGAILAALSTAPGSVAEWTALLLGVAILSKGALFVLAPDRSAVYLRRVCGRSDSSWRLPGAAALLTIVVLTTAEFFGL